jgi:hypothetical protein
LEPGKPSPETFALTWTCRGENEFSLVHSESAGDRAENTRKCRAKSGICVPEYRRRVRVGYSSICQEKFTKNSLS